jgi:hypothetical protein
VIDNGLPLTFEDMQNDPEYRTIAHTKFMLNAGFRGAVFYTLEGQG